jgi:hypothetical protein
MHALETAIAATNKAARKAIGRFIDLLPSIRVSGTEFGQSSGVHFRRSVEKLLETQLLKGGESWPLG